MDRNEDRGTGRTTEQIKAAPRGALYVCIRAEAGYAKAPAHALGRPDLKFAGPEAVGERLLGLRAPVVVDHAVRLDPLQRMCLQAYANRR